MSGAAPKRDLSAVTDAAYPQTFEEAFAEIDRLRRIEAAARAFIAADERFFVDGDDVDERLAERDEAKRQLCAAVMRTRRGGT
ncbi:MAG TPA: hypothetical protein VFT98_03595 [Myxococcota bacterium]|nr:hypothetical protein [Myxococcota bacterium]